ncbi:tetratricopeptide repeat protein [Geobacter sp. FeAm09]|uniref:tetratricopeptide repeat protein n=1 Tax=Geobacter sp. FeAm09 TaxID=2597769 RepID=UPI0011EE40A1|nr:tetratricopeptide repeat protein [Geobacter sp. FeAm09]QEM68139.1 tetratricopeptide repeat protein [Geobacter sp. FeAm09]
MAAGTKRLTAHSPLRLPGGGRWGVRAVMAALMVAAPWTAGAAAPEAAAPAQTAPPVVAPVAPGSGDSELFSLREQIARAPEDAVLHVRLGYLLLNAGALAEAKTAFDEALKHNRHSHAAMTGEGILLARAGNLKEAEQVLLAALVRNPDPVRTHYELGRVYEASGDLDKALAEYKEGIAKYRQGRK